MVTTGAVLVTRNLQRGGNQIYFNKLRRATPNISPSYFLKCRNLGSPHSDNYTSNPDKVAILYLLRASTFRFHAAIFQHP